MNPESTGANSGMNKLQANLCLLCVTLCWSMESVIYACIPESVSPFATTSITSFVGSLILFFCFFKRVTDHIRKNTKRVLRRCFILAVLNCIYNALYLFGFQNLDLSTGAFSISITAVILPIVLISMNSTVKKRTWFSSGVIMLGIVFALFDTLKIEQIKGIFFIVLGCIFRAYYIIILNKYAKEDDPVTLSSTLSFMVGIMGFIIWFISHPATFREISWNRQIVASLVIYSYFIVGFAQTLNIFAQKRSTPTNATIIYSMEIVFTVIWGCVLPATLIAPVKLTLYIVIGTILIFIGNVIEIIDWDYFKAKFRGEAQYEGEG